MHQWVDEINPRGDDYVNCYHDIIHTYITSYTLNANMLFIIDNCDGNMHIRSNTVKPQLGTQQQVPDIAV